MAAAVHDADLFQIALLVDQLRHDDVHHRVSAVQSVASIASALGTERTREELIPFLAESMDDEQEVLQAIAEKLGPLESLVMNEQLSVRDAAIGSCETCAEQMPPDHLLAYYVPFITRLAKKDMYLARISATSLLSAAFARGLPESVKVDLSVVFLTLCGDPTPLVRRAAAINFPRMVRSVNLVQVQTDYLIAFANFASHEQESIRIQSIAICIVLCELLPLEQKTSKVLPVVLALARDKAWRVRYTFVSRLHEVLSRVPSAENALVAAFDALLNDTETEVRGAAAGSVANMSAHLSKELVRSKLVPSLQRLTMDSSESVRIAAASGLGQLVNVLSQEETVEFVLPLLLVLLRDEVSDVRLSVIAKLDALNQMLGVEVLSQSLLPAINALAVDSKWRVRLAIIEHVPLLLSQMTAPFFREKLTDICLSWLSDSVSAVRVAAVETLRRVQSKLGENWVLVSVLPRLESLTMSRNYLLRLTGLHAIQAVSVALSAASIETLLLPKVSHLVKDPVPNVRMNCAATLVVLLKSLPSTSSSRKGILEHLSELSTDTDRDVKFAAALALKDASVSQTR